MHQARQGPENRELTQKSRWVNSNGKSS